MAQLDRRSIAIGPSQHCNWPVALCNWPVAALQLARRRVNYTAAFLELAPWALGRGFKKVVTFRMVWTTFKQRRLDAGSSVAATGGAGAGAPAAAEWDDRGEHDIALFGCSPPHLSVPLIPRHAGGGDASQRRSPERERRFGLSCRGACGC